MLHRAWNSKGEMPYCFPRLSIKFQGHTALKIVQFDPNWAFPDCNFSLNSPMAMKCCTELETTKERCPIVFQGHPSNFKVTRDKTSLILSQIGHFRTIGRSQLSNPSDLPCLFVHGTSRSGKTGMYHVWKYFIKHFINITTHSEYSKIKCIFLKQILRLSQTELASPIFVEMKINYVFETNEIIRWSQVDDVHVEHDGFTQEHSLPYSQAWWAIGPDKHLWPTWLKHAGDHMQNISGETPYHQLSQNVEAARNGFQFMRSLWNLTGFSASMLPRRLSNSKVIR